MSFADAFDGKYLLENKTVGTTEQTLKKVDQIRAIVYVTFLDGTRMLKEVIAKATENYVYCYRNDKRVNIVLVEGQDFKEVEVERKPVTGRTWKFGKNGRAIRS